MSPSRLAHGTHCSGMQACPSCPPLHCWEDAALRGVPARQELAAQMDAEAADAAAKLAAERLEQARL